MAKINRFYLFIAALVMSKTYDASAATKLPWDTCYSIKTYCNSSSSGSELGEISCDFWDSYQGCYDAYAGGGFYYSYPAGSNYPDMEYLCPTDSWQYQEEGNLTSNSFCPEGAAIEENVISYCCANQNIGGYAECMAVVHGDMQCSDGAGSGGGDEPSYIPPSCISGQYWDLWGAPGLGANGGAGSCTTCPTYNYASGKYFSDLASSSQRNTDTSAAGTGGNVQFCYVPRGNVFTDNSGTFQYVSDCYYYGS